MSFTFLILCMIFCHIIDDYCLQGWLASAKQRDWWKKNAPEKLYKYDYIWALIMHSFSWSFMIMLPGMIFLNAQHDEHFLLIFIWNVVVHAIVDHLKANMKLINLWIDQIVHIFQIVLTATVLW